MIDHLPQEPLHNWSYALGDQRVRPGSNSLKHLGLAAIGAGVAVWIVGIGMLLAWGL